MRILLLMVVAGFVTATTPFAIGQTSSCNTTCNNFISGKRIPGGVGDATSANECQARCQSNAACYGWMFWTESAPYHPNSCEFVGSAAKVSDRTHSALVSGLKAGTSSGPTNRTGTAGRSSTFMSGKYWSDILRTVSTAAGKGARFCMTACIADQNCAAWDYQGDRGICRHLDAPLGSQVTADAKNVSAGVIVTGAAPATAPATMPTARTSTTTFGVVVTARLDQTLRAETWMPNADSCVAACIRETKCVAWQWTTQGIQTSCLLLHGHPSAIVKSANPKDAVGIIRVATTTTTSKPSDTTRRDTATTGATTSPPPDKTATIGIPSDPRQALAAGMTAAQQGQHARAVELFTAALGSNKLDAASRLGALRRRGESLWVLRRNDEAKADYDAALAAKPDDAGTLARRAVLLHAMGQTEAAKADADRAVAADPRMMSAYVARGTLRENAGDYDAAAADLAQAALLATTPVGKARALEHRGRILRAAGRLNEALADLDQALMLQPDSTVALALRGYARIAVGRYDEARADFDRLAALTPDSPLPPRGRGLADAARGNFALAAKEFAQLASAAPTDPYAHIYVFLTQERSGQWGWPDLARAASRLDVKKWPAPIRHHLLGNLGADALLAAAKSDDPKTERVQTCEAEFYLGQSALLSGDKAGARQRFERATAICSPTFTESIWAKAELVRLASPQ